MHPMPFFAAARHRTCPARRRVRPRRVSLPSAPGFLLLLAAARLVAATPLAAAPGDVIWVFQGIENINASAEVPDLDLDGVPEIATETFDSGAGTADHLYLLSGGSTGVPQILWSARPPGGPSSSGGYGDDCLNGAPDLDADGFPDLVLGTAWGGRSAYGINGRTGATLWSFDTYIHTPPIPATSGWVYTIHPIADLDNDLVADVIFGCGSYNDGAYAVNGSTGSVIYRLNALDAIYSSAPLGDVTGDGKAEAVFGGGDGDTRAYCVSGASVGTATTQWIVSLGGTAWHTHEFVDVNGDQRDDVLFAVYSAAGQARCVSGVNGAPIWTYTTGASDFGMRIVPLDDVNGDQVPDVVVGSYDNATHVVSGASGAPIWVRDAGTLNGGDVWAVDRVDDVTGDGISDVIAGSFDRQAYLYDGVTGDLIWSVDVGARVMSVRGVSDLSGNGVPDVLVGTQMLSGVGGRLFCLEGNDAAGVAMPEPTVVARTAGIAIEWAVDAFAPGTTFNAYRRDLEAAAAGGSRDQEIVSLQAELARAGLRARDMMRLEAELSADDPFIQLNADPILGDGAVARFLDRTAVAGSRYEYRIGFTEPGTPAELYLVPVMATAAGTPAMPLRLSLPRPQPARTAVHLELAMAEGIAADVMVAAPNGRVVRHLGRGLRAEEGPAAIVWDGRDDAGEPAAQGVYLVTATAGPLRATRKVVFLP